MGGRVRGKGARFWGLLRATGPWFWEGGKKQTELGVGTDPRQ